MRTRHPLAGIVASLLTTLLCGTTLAASVTSIESVDFEYAHYRDHATIGGAIQTIVPVYRADQRIFLVAGLRGGKLDQDQGQDYDRIGFELGLQYRLTPITHITLAASHDWFTGVSDYTSGAAHIRLRQALDDAQAPVVPFVRLNGSLHFLDPEIESPARQARSYNLLVVEALVGLEVRMRKDFRWVFEGGRSQSQALDNAGPDLADGWLGRIAMQYDWF